VLEVVHRCGQDPLVRAREADRLASTTAQPEAAAGLGASDRRADHPGVGGYPDAGPAVKYPDI
jgi:hypothetical protein